MDCPRRAAPDPSELGRRTALGCRTFRCRGCARTSNERTGTPFTHPGYPTDVVLPMRRRLHHTLSLRDLAAIFLGRGIDFTHEAACGWEERVAPLLAERLRARRRVTAGTRWFVDETYVQVQGRPCSLFRAIDRDGNLVDSLLREHRDMAAARRCFVRATEVVGHGPTQATTDGHTPTLVPSGRPRGRGSSIAAAGICTTGRSRTIGGSRDATSRCAASAASPGRPVSAAPSTSYATTSLRSLNGVAVRSLQRRVQAAQRKVR